MSTALRVLHTHTDLDKRGLCEIVVRTLDSTLSTHSSFQKLFLATKKKLSRSTRAAIPRIDPYLLICTVSSSTTEAFAEKYQVQRSGQTKRRRVELDDAFGQRVVIWQHARDQLQKIGQDSWEIENVHSIRKHAGSIEELLSLFASPLETTDAYEELQNWLFVKLKSYSMAELSRRVAGLIYSLMAAKEPVLFGKLRDQVENKIRRQPKAFNGDGSEVYVSSWSKSYPSAALVLKWSPIASQTFELPYNGKDKGRLILPPEVFTPFKDEKRYLYFVGEGIDIRDGLGNTLGPQIPTVRLRELKTSMAEPQRAAFLELWSKHTGCNIVQQGPTTLKSSLYTTRLFHQGSRPNMSLVVGAGAKQINEANEARRVQQALPLQPGDAHWLLHKFLSAEYPRGGLVVGTSILYCAPGVSVRSKLEAFVQRPELSQHPHLAQLSDVVKTANEPRATPGCNQALKVALQILRPPYSEKRYRARGHRVVEYHIGARAPLNVVPASIDI